MLAESQGLAVRVIDCQATAQHGDRRRQKQEGVPEHDGGTVQHLSEGRGITALGLGHQADADQFRDLTG